MSTRCRIGLSLGDRIESIYCQHDGYPVGEYSVGQMLKYYYTDDALIMSLLELGDLSALGSSPIADPHGWNINLEYDHTKCINYASRGDTDTEKLVSDSEKQYIEDAYNSDVNFIYLYKDKAWHMLSGKPAKFKPF